MKLRSKGAGFRPQKERDMMNNTSKIGFFETVAAMMSGFSGTTRGAAKAYAFDLMPSPNSFSPHRTRPGWRNEQRLRRAAHRDYIRRRNARRG